MTFRARNFTLPGAVALLLGSMLFAACGPKYPKCNKDSQCAEQGEVCVDGTCQQCRDDSNCPEGQRCQGGRCEVKPECSMDGDCKNNQVCRSGKCQTECTQDADCGGGLKCLDNRCVDRMACKTTQDCETGLECMSGRCTAMNASRSMCTMPTVYFDFNESVLTSGARQSLSDVADCLKSKNNTVTVEGHCDERGTEEYNLALGDRRAQSVVKYLSTLGVASSKLRPVSKGELEPADPGHSEAAWDKNRRAVFIER